MLPDPSDDQATREVLRRSCLFGAPGTLLALLTHCLVNQQWPVMLVGIEGLCILFYVLLARVMHVQRLDLRVLGVLSGGVAIVVVTALAHASGGPLSPFFQVLGALPFILALFTPGTYLPTLLSGASALVAVLMLDILFGLPTSTLWLQGFASAAMVGVALVCSRMYWRMIEAQREAHAAHLEALGRLAESERLRGRAERERAEVERLVLVGQLAAGVAHEVNNPLAYVKANLGLLSEEIAGDAPPQMEREELRALLDETRQGVVRIQQIITDLRGVSRAGQEGEEQGGALEEAVREAGRLASVRLGREGVVALDLPPELPTVRLGQRHLVQILVNLLLNAADAVEGARPARQTHITVGARWEGPEVLVWVEDNGPGIPPDVLPRIFDPFFTTKPPGKGTGLGLALCHEYISRAGGTLSAENPTGGGARFVLRLPVATHSPSSVADTPRAEPGTAVTT